MTNIDTAQGTTINISINDRWMFLYLYPPLSILVVHIGNDNSFSALLQNPTYYTDLIFSMASSYLIGFYLRKVYRNINKHFNWGKDQKKIVLKALKFGVLLPTALIVSIEMLYLMAIEIDILGSSIFYLELPLIVVFCLLYNLIYLFQYDNAYAKVINKDLTEKNIQKNNTVIDHFAVGSGLKKKVVNKEDIAYFLVDNKLTFLITFAGNRHLIEYPLKELKAKFSETDFFLLNRQILANRRSIVSYTRTETRRLEIKLNPALKDDVFVAKSNAKQFTDWMSLS